MCALSVPLVCSCRGQKSTRSRLIGAGMSGRQTVRLKSAGAREVACPTQCRALMPAAASAVRFECAGRSSRLSGDGRELAAAVFDRQSPARISRQAANRSPRGDLAHVPLPLMADSSGHDLWVPRWSSTSCGLGIFVYQSPSRSRRRGGVWVVTWAGRAAFARPVAGSIGAAWMPWTGRRGGEAAFNVASPSHDASVTAWRA